MSSATPDRVLEALARPTRPVPRQSHTGTETTRSDAPAADDDRYDHDDRLDDGLADRQVVAVGIDRARFLRRSGGLVALAALDWSSAAEALAGVDPRVRRLAAVVRGPVLTSRSPGYDAARVPYNSRYRRVRPLAVVRPLGPGDVSRTILWARRNGVRLAARSGGHSYAGYSTTRGVVVDLRNLHAIRVDRGSGTATVGAGARLIDVERKLARHGVAIPTGSCPTVGVGGLALGGGVGLASRAWGTTSDNLLEVEVVTADGRVRTCSRRRNPELFWGCRGGGGGNFGIATRFTFRVHRVSTVSWFVAEWPWTEAEAVVAAWQAFGPHAPDALFTLCRLARGAGTPSIEVFGQFIGAESRLRTLLAPLAAVPGIHLTTGTSSYLDAQLRWAGCLGKTSAACAAPGHATFAAKSDYAKSPLSPAGIRVLRRRIEQAQAQAWGKASVVLDSYGGAINRVKPGATAFVHRDALFSMQELAYWSGSAGPRALAWLRGLHAELRPHVSGFAYQNYIDPELASWKHAYYGSNLARLVALKHSVDPDDFFRFAQSIPTHR
jgi:FAD/FMN-containing dehydrogenase